MNLHTISSLCLTNNVHVHKTFGIWQLYVQLLKTGGGQRAEYNVTMSVK